MPGRLLGVPTPLNASLVDLVHYVEQAGQFWTVEAIRATISAEALSLSTV